LEGFYEALEKIWQPLNQYVHNNRHNRTVWICGHSLGGALATLTASRITFDGLYTYGCPRVGDTKFATAMDKNKNSIHRFVNYVDIVPAVPGPIFYTHCGTLQYFTGANKLLSDPPWWRQYSPKKLLTSVNLFKDISYHDSSKYVTKLKYNLGIIKEI
jgi:predicted lipase